MRGWGSQDQFDALFPDNGRTAADAVIDESPSCRWHAAR
jgi:hypothetical protein